MPLYDYIYVDLEKVTSLYSQLSGSVVELRESNKEQAHSAGNKRNYDFKVFKHDTGGTDQGKSGVKEVIKPHHSLLTELEQELAGNGYLIDLTDPSALRSLRDPDFRRRLRSTLCVKVRGRAVIEDYERIKSIAHVFPEVVKLINRSTKPHSRPSSGFLDLQSQIEILMHATKVGMVDQWILDGLKTWIDTFLPGIVNLRVYPLNNRPDEHVFGHLKKSYFGVADSNSFHFAYGTLPTESLTMIGIITSVPDENSDSFKPFVESGEEPLADYESVERALRGTFRGFEGIERMIRTCHFPRVLVHPLTVYRSVTGRGNK